MHPLSGIRQKLLAFDRLLEEFPRLRRIVCMIQYVIPTDCPKSMGLGCASEMIWQTKRDIEELVKTINLKYRDCIIYKEKCPSKLARLALWSESNFFFNTVLRDGCSILPLEFIAVKHADNKFSSSSVILSQFSGCNHALTGTLVVNAHNPDDIKNAMDTAINMRPDERIERLRIAYSYIEE